VKTKTIVVFFAFFSAAPVVVVPRDRPNNEKGKKTWLGLQQHRSVCEEK
jgi:hypothetical protein